MKDQRSDQVQQLTPRGSNPFGIVSGGQTGVDRAALDAAHAAGIEAGGWCPRGRLAEDGVLDARYPLRETPSDDVSQRTRWNVRDSEATLILHAGEISGGTALTRIVALEMKRPVLEVEPGSPDAAYRTVDWIRSNGFTVLNVAGPRESEAPGIYATALTFLKDLFEQLSGAEGRTPAPSDER